MNDRGSILMFSCRSGFAVLTFRRKDFQVTYNGRFFREGSDNEADLYAPRACGYRRGIGTGRRDGRRVGGGGGRTAGQPAAVRFPRRVHRFAGLLLPHSRLRHDRRSGGRSPRREQDHRLPWNLRRIGDRHRQVPPAHQPGGHDQRARHRQLRRGRLHGPDDGRLDDQQRER
jgi:hypothetical protein